MKTKKSVKIRIKGQKSTWMRSGAVRSSEEWEWWAMDGFCGFTHVYFHNYKVHVRADTWDGGKCLCGLVDNRGLSCFSGLGRGGRRSWGLRKSLGPLTPSGAQGELVLLNGLFDPSAQAGLVEGLDECLLGRVVLCGCLLGFMVGTGPEHLDPQDGRQLKGREKQREREERK